MRGCLWVFAVLVLLVLGRCGWREMTLESRALSMLSKAVPALKMDAVRYLYSTRYLKENSYLYELPSKAAREQLELSNRPLLDFSSSKDLIALSLAKRAVTLVEKKGPRDVDLKHSEVYFIYEDAWKDSGNFLGDMYLILPPGDRAFLVMNWF